MLRVRFLTALIMVFLSTVGVDLVFGENAFADSKYSRPISMIVIDGASARSSGTTADLASSFIGLLSTLQSDDLFMLMNTDASDQVVGPFRPSDPAFNESRADFDAALRWPVAVDVDDLATSMVQIQASMVEERAEKGSEIYILLGDSSETDFNRLSTTLEPLIGRMAESGWIFNGVSLPNSSGPTTEFLESVSSASGGKNFGLKTFEDLATVAGSILGQKARGSLMELGSRPISKNQLMSSVVSIAPGTSETTIFMFRDKSQGSFQLSDPSGFDISAGRSFYSVKEVPNAVIWEVQDPEPGNWKVDVRGIEGKISAWDYSSNNYRLVLETASALPLGQTTAMAAYIVENDRPVKLEDVRLVAHIEGPEGSKIKIQMTDDGSGGDGVPDDGVYTMLVPPLSTAGDYKVELELSWLNFNHRLSSYTNFSAEIYPSLSVERFEDAIGNLVSGERTQIARLMVHIDGEPYAISSGDLIPIINSTNGSSAEIEIVPNRLFGEGPAWEYDVFVTVSHEGKYSLAMQLSGEYAGSNFSNITEVLVLSSLVPATVSQNVAEQVVQSPPAPAPAIAQRPQTIVPAASRSEASVTTTSFWTATWTIVAIALVGAGIAIYFSLQTRPYGYIYSDDEKPLVDFAAVKRNPLIELFRRSYVNGKELGIPGLEGIMFRFGGGRVRLRIRGEHSTVRVNNQPLVDQATIDNRTWIGSRGKLYTFLLSPPVSNEGISGD